MGPFGAFVFQDTIESVQPFLLPFVKVSGGCRACSATPYHKNYNIHMRQMRVNKAYLAVIKHKWDAKNYCNLVFL